MASTESKNNNTIDITNSQIANNNKYSEQEYSNYVDSSDLVINIYKNSHVSGLEKYFLQIEDWIDKPIVNSIEENMPYVIEAEEGVGKKTLLVKWMEYHQQKVKKYPDIILSHFSSSGGNNTNYFFAIYRILNKLRDALDIQQKVELLEEKLRKYFSYWLNHCSDKLEKQLQQGEKVFYDKIIIIIEGIDLFIDQYNKEAYVSFWLPRFFPEHIKIIVTCEKQSQANQYFQTLGCQFLKIPIEQNIVQRMIERHRQRELFVNEETREKHINIVKSYQENDKNPNFYKIFLCTLLPYPTSEIVNLHEIQAGSFEKIFDRINYDQLQNIQNFNGLIEFILSLYSNNIMAKDKFIKLLRVFSLTQKGLTLEEIQRVTGISSEQWCHFIACFKFFILNYKGLWIMNNDSLKKIIQEQFKTDEKEIRDLYEEIAQMLEKHTPNSIRKLEEQTFHLLMSKNYFKLKEIVSTIENFLLLFNPNNKYDLCRYWQILQEQGFDPVIEYNKAIEGFEMHYHPSSQDVFRIIVQISRFLKEFADFETYYTPKFRHPPIKGTCEELEDIGLLKELLGLDIFSSKDQEDVKKIMNHDKFKRSIEQKIIDKKQGMKKRAKNKENKEISFEKKGNLQSLQKKEKISDSILSKIESLNVDIPTNREIFHKTYEKEIWDIMKENNYQHQEEQYHLDNIEEQEEKSKDEDEESLFENKNEEKSVISIQKIREYYNLKERTPTNYYYKRWLWVQFPWACLSLKCDYSTKLKECFSSPIEYMSVKKEKQFTKQALKIAIEAKLKKQMMYKKSENSTNTEQKSQENKALLPKNIQYNCNTLPSIQEKTKQSFSRVSQNKMRASKEQQPFLITHQYLSFQTLNKQLEGHQENQNTSSLQYTIQNTSKILEKSKLFKDKSKFFDPISNLQDSQNYSSVLPRLKVSILDHSNKEIQVLEQQALIMKKELDNLSYSNRNLAKSFKQLKISEYNQNKYGVNPEKIQQVLKQLTGLEEQITKTDDDYFEGLIQIERLKTIIKICEDNKQQNEDWIRNLNFLLNNFKKMIRWEQEDIKIQKEEINQLQKINSDYQKAFKQKMNSQQNLINHIEKSIKDKEIFDSLFFQTDNLIEKSALGQIEKLKLEQKGIDTKKLQKDRKTQLEKSSKQIQEQLEKNQAMHEKLSHFINIFDTNYYHSPKFQKLLAERDKQDDLKAIVLSRQDQINTLREHLEQKQSHLETIYKAFNVKESERDLIGEDEKNEVKDVERYDDKEHIQLRIGKEQSNEKKMRILNKLEQDRLCCLMIIGTIQKKLKIQQSSQISETLRFSEEEVINCLEEKVNVIKSKLIPEDFVVFNEGNFDFAIVYKKLVEQIPVEDFKSFQQVESLD